MAAAIASGKKARDPRAHRIAHDVGALDPQMRKEVDCIPGHEIGAIIGGRVELLALPMTAVVERHNAAPSLRQRFDPTRVDPVDAKVGGEAMNEQDRLAEIPACRRDIDKRDVDASR
jgi:hypothetical protein